MALLLSFKALVYPALRYPTCSLTAGRRASLPPVTLSRRSLVFLYSFLYSFLIYTVKVSCHVHNKINIFKMRFDLDPPIATLPFSLSLPLSLSTSPY